MLLLFFTLTGCKTVAADSTTSSGGGEAPSVNALDCHDKALELFKRHCLNQLVAGDFSQYADEDFLTDVNNTEEFKIEYNESDWIDDRDYGHGTVQHGYTITFFDIDGYKCVATVIILYDGGSCAMCDTITHLNEDCGPDEIQEYYRDEIEGVNFKTFEIISNDEDADEDDGSAAGGAGGAGGGAGAGADEDDGGAAGADEDDGAAGGAGVDRAANVYDPEGPAEDPDLVEG